MSALRTQIADLTKVVVKPKGGTLIAVVPLLPDLWRVDVFVQKLRICEDPSKLDRCRSMLLYLTSRTWDGTRGADCVKALTDEVLEALKLSKPRLAQACCRSAKHVIGDEVRREAGPHPTSSPQPAPSADIRLN